MATETYPIELMVQTHPSGRWTLVGKQGPGQFEQLEGELCGNADPTNFYRAVATFMGKLGAAGTHFVYHDEEAS